MIYFARKRRPRRTNTDVIRPFILYESDGIKRTLLTTIVLLGYPFQKVRCVVLGTDVLV